MRTANAKPMPKPKPGSAESLRQKAADLETATELLKAAKVVEREPVAPDVDLQAFSRAYARWLRARAAIKGDEFPEDEKAARAVFAEERAALRELLCLPALHVEDLWQKFEAFEAEFTDERVVGEASDSILPLALGAIKNDICNLGVGRPA